MNSKFTFMPRGEHRLHDVYRVVQGRFPELCDDTVLCKQTCTEGTEGPEWKHRVRAALQRLKTLSGPVLKCQRHGYWIFNPGQSVEAATDVTESVEEYPEGRMLLRLHRRKERNPKAVRRKKETVLAASGKLLCEVCDFDFAVVYGALGNGFAECHHRVPLGQLKVEQRVRLSELAIVCANCHRMLHRRPPYRVEELRVIVLSRCGLG